MPMREATPRAPLVRPILKWAGAPRAPRTLRGGGGRPQLLPALRRYYPSSFVRYFEPFVGSGAVFLDLHNAGALDGREVRLSDINADVIGCYRAVRDDAPAVIRALRALEAAHVRGGAAHFYDVRNSRFNPARRALQGAARPADYTPELAAMLVYLNRTGYNGLFRVNARGEFNVPAGRYAHPRICDEANLLAWGAALRRPGLTLDVLPFDAALSHAHGGDFVYLDPPYSPLSATARFTAYSASGFGSDAQHQLQRCVLDLARKGAFVLLSNSAAPEIERLYACNIGVRSAGLRARQVPARRAINSHAGRRGPVHEYVITNVPEARP